MQNNTQNKTLDAVFASLADPTRRDIVRRVSRRKLSITEIAGAYERQMSLAAVSKHLKVLERSGLVRKKRRGKHQIVALSPPALRLVDRYLAEYRQLWEERLDRLETYLKSK